MSTAETADHTEALLLPWYVNGTLSKDERSRVAQHLEQCSDCRSAVVELRRMDEVISEDATTPLVPQPRVAEFMNGLDNGDAEPQTSRNTPWFAVAACLLALVGAAWFAMTLPPEANEFRPVTDQQGVGTVSYVFDVEFNEGAVDAVRQNVSSSIANGEILESADGYRLVVEMPSATMSELETFADELREIDGVERVGIVVVQVPFE